MSAQLRQEAVRAHYGADNVDHPPVRRKAARRLKRRRLAIGLLAVCLCAGGLGAAASMRHVSSDLELARKSGSVGRVALLSAVAERKLGFVTVTGSVENRAGRLMPQLEAVVELLDDRGRTIGLESALLAFDTVRAGEQAPFRVEMQDAARASKYRVRFRQLMGPAVD